MRRASDTPRYGRGCGNDESGGLEKPWRGRERGLGTEPDFPAGRCRGWEGRGCAGWFWGGDQVAATEPVPSWPPAFPWELFSPGSSSGRWRWRRCRWCRAFPMEAPGSRRCCHRESRPSPNLSLARSALIAGRVPHACFPALTKHLCMEDLMPGIKHIIVNLPLIKPN